jgi:lipopolysaccharide export system protein LptA
VIAPFFFDKEQKIEVTGNVTMKDGSNIIEGDKAIFFIAENRGIVESSPSKRVKAVIYPGSQTKKP